VFGALLSIPRGAADGFIRPRAFVDRLERGVYGSTNRQRALFLGLFYFANLLAFSLPILLGPDGVYDPALESDSLLVTADYALQEVVIAAADIIAYSGWALVLYHLVLWLAGRSRGAYQSVVVFARTTTVYLFSLFTLSTLLYGGTWAAGAREFVADLAKSLLLFGVEIYVELTGTTVFWTMPYYARIDEVAGIPNSVALNGYRLSAAAEDGFQYAGVQLTSDPAATLSPDGSVLTHTIGTEQVAAFAEIQQPTFSTVGAVFLAAFLVVLLYFSYSLYLSARLHNRATRGEAAIAASVVFVAPLVFLPIGTAISAATTGMGPAIEGIFQKGMLFAPVLLLLAMRPLGVAVDHLR